MKKDRKKMWQVVCLFVLSLILSGAFGAMGAEADAKAYEFIIPDVDIEYLSSADIQDMPLQVVCYAKNENLCPSWTDVPVPGADELL